MWEWWAPSNGAGSSMSQRQERSRVQPREREKRSPPMRKMLNYFSLIALVLALVVPLAGCQQAE